MEDESATDLTRQFRLGHPPVVKIKTLAALFLLSFIVTAVTWIGYWWGLHAAKYAGRNCVRY